ncbi:hypothetical protein K438DRAFT_2045904, partial [Mycena galopus ATCC 62051]
LVIDWFNPFTMKIAGRVVSYGAIVLHCLNLPIELRFLLENREVAQKPIIPGDPDIWTITHILTSFAEMMNKFSPPGKAIKTFKNPLGVMVAARILPFIADLQALRKVAGYMACNATQFYTWCLLVLDKIEDLDHGSWILRDSATVSAQARVWHEAVSVTAKNILSKASGVRWSPIHDIAQFDPVNHILLGFMHNWLEGVLMRHLRVLWGIGRPKTNEKKAVGTLDDIDGYATPSEMTETSDSEREHDEPVEFRTIPHPRQQTPEASTSHINAMDVDEESDDSTTPTPETYLGIPPEDFQDEEEDFIILDALGMFNFSPAEIGCIRTCISNISLPTWVARPPRNLGEASHGKLKAYESLILFTVIFPLIIPELWWGKGTTELAFLQNFHHLVACTNVVSSFSTSNTLADLFTNHYVKYRKALPQLFPIKFKSVSNHHFAQHNGSLLKFWGPFSALNEFAGERMNGMLQKIKTNRNTGE